MKTKATIPQNASVVNILGLCISGIGIFLVDDIVCTSFDTTFLLALYAEERIYYSALTIASLSRIFVTPHASCITRSSQILFPPASTAKRMRERIRVFLHDHPFVYCYSCQITGGALRVIPANMVETLGGYARFFSGYREETTIVTRSGVGNLVAASTHAALMIPAVAS